MFKKLKIFFWTIINLPSLLTDVDLELKSLEERLDVLLKHSNRVMKRRWAKVIKEEIAYADRNLWHIRNCCNKNGKECSCRERARDKAISDNE